MAETWRLLDTGLTAPAEAIALSRALLEARHADEIPNTLRFSRVTRCVLLGSSQSASQELDVEYCRAHGVAIQRRVTGGAAAYLDPGQLVWELFLRRSDAGTNLDSIAQRLCHAAATALSALGVDARYRPRRDVEIDGRALGTGGFAAEGDAILFQSPVLLDCEAADALGPLRTPWRSLSTIHASEASKRIVSLKQALGRKPDVATVKHNLVEAFESEFEIEFREGDLDLSEQSRCRTAVAEIDSPQWIEHISRGAEEIPLVEAAHRSGAGVLHVTVALERATKSLRQVWFGGEPAIAPARVLVDLEAALRGVSVDRLAQRINSFFASRAVDMRGFAPGDFTAVLLKAASQRLVAGSS